MKRSIFVVTTSALTISLMAALSARAAQHGHAGPPPKVNQGHAATSPKPAPVPHGPSVSHGGGSTKTHTTASGHGNAGAHAAGKATKPAKTTIVKTKTAKTTTGKTTTTLSPVQQKLQRNTKLAEKLQGRLPAGTDLVAASAGFRNLGQFVAAVNVSNNHGLRFTDLKTRMVDQHMSLGQAMQDLRGGTDTQIIALRAEQDADHLIRTTTTTTTTTTVKPKPKAKPRTTHGDL